MSIALWYVDACVNTHEVESTVAHLKLLIQLTQDHCCHFCNCSEIISLSTAQKCCHLGEGITSSINGKRGRKSNS